MSGKRAALLIGVSEFGAEYQPLPNVVWHLEQLQRVLQNPEIGGFEVEALLNPSPQTMREAIEHFFRGQTKEDVALLYYSGRGEIDSLNPRQFYLATHMTRKEQGQLVEASIVEAQFLYRQLVHSRADAIVVILDCDYSGCFASFFPAEDSITAMQELSSKGLAILMSCTATEALLQVEEPDETNVLPLSFTHYLVEGMETGAARRNRHQWIRVQDLYDYVCRRMQSESGVVGNPQLLLLGDKAHQVGLSKVAKADPITVYRQMVNLILRENNGELGVLDRHYLYIQRYQLDLSPSVAWEIETEQVALYRIRLQKQQLYAKALAIAVKQEYPFSPMTYQKLERIQIALNLEKEEAIRIENRLLKQLSEGTPQPDHPGTKTVFLPSLSSPEDSQTANQDHASDRSFTRNGRSAQPPIDQTMESLPLLSAKEIDYSKLRELLQAQNWKEADRETSKAMLQVAGKIKKGYLAQEDIETFPCEDLNTIDRLWVEHSNGRFGFSVQKDIWHSLGGMDQYDPAIEQLFCSRVGWAEQGKRVSPSFDFDDPTSVPTGMLPTCLWAGGRLFWWWIVTIQARLEHCRRSQWLQFLATHSNQAEN